MKKCVYCNRTDVKFSGEHVISKCVLEAAFGNPKDNYTYMRGKYIDKLELKINDVCTNCNSQLSVYDSAGSRLVRHLQKKSDNPLRFNFDKETSNWLIKSHLNFLRTVNLPENVEYIIDEALYQNLIKRHHPVNDLCNLYIQIWGKGGKYLSDNDQDITLPFFEFTSCPFSPEKVLISKFRIKYLDTVLLLPLFDNNSKYIDFHKRAQRAIERINVFSDVPMRYIDFENATDIIVSETVSFPQFIKSTQELNYSSKSSKG